MPTTVPNVTAGDLITEAWGDAVRLAIEELQSAPPNHASRHQPGGADAIPTATAGASAVGDTAATGTSTSLARADHRHSREAFGAVSAAAAGDASTNGTATTLARSDHKHGLPVASAVAVGTANAGGSSSSVSRADHVHQLIGSASNNALQAGSGSTGSLATATSTDVTITWSTAFGGTPTAVAVGVANTVAGITAPSYYIKSVSSSNVVVTVRNNDASTRTFSVYAIAIA